MKQTVSETGCIPDIIEFFDPVSETMKCIDTIEIIGYVPITKTVRRVVLESQGKKYYQTVEGIVYKLYLRNNKFVFLDTISHRRFSGVIRHRMHCHKKRLRFNPNADNVSEEDREMERKRKEKIFRSKVNPDRTSGHPKFLRSPKRKKIAKERKTKKQKVYVRPRCEKCGNSMVSLSYQSKGLKHKLGFVCPSCKHTTQ